MTTQTLSVGSEPEIEIERVGGDLIIAGWERAELEARSDDPLDVEQNGEEVTVSCGSDLNISVPRDASLSITYVGGDIKVENLNGDIKLAFIGGDAVLQNLTGHVAVGGSVGGDVKMENVSKISMNAGRGVPVSDISEKVRRKVEAANRRADEATRRAEQKVARIMSRQAGRIPPIPPSHQYRQCRQFPPCLTCRNRDAGTLALIHPISRKQNNLFQMKSAW